MQSAERLDLACDRPNEARELTDDGYVPHARIGFVTDIWSPGAAFPAKPNPGLVSVVAAVKKANIQPERFVGGHGTISDYNLLVRFVGQ